MWIADQWKDYEVLDTSGGEKLERWGDYLLVRPDPQVIWNTPKDLPGWRKMNGHYYRSSKGGGELQMVLIARALTIFPSMLVLDEPESNLDFKNQLIILETIQKLSKNRGISAIVNTHYPEHALKISDKALLLNQDGTNIFGDAAEVINVENMRHSFSVQVHINQFSVDGREYRSVVPLHLV